MISVQLDPAVADEDPEGRTGSGRVLAPGLETPGYPGWYGAWARLGYKLWTSRLYMVVKKSLASICVFPSISTTVIPRL